MSDCLNSTITNTPAYYDPLGTDTGVNSGQSERYKIYDQMNTQMPSINAATGDYVNALKSAAYNPVRGDEMQYEKDVLSGKYLNGSPALDEAMAQMRNASSRAVGDANAKTAGSFAQNGMSYGTGNQEAQMANTALETANAGQSEAQARLTNYQTERGYQNTAPTAIESLIQAPVSYLSAIPAAYTAPLTAEADIVKGLSGGGTVATPTTNTEAGVLSQVKDAASPGLCA